MKTFGYKLRQIREEKKITQAELSKGTGIKQSAISSYENDKYMPSIDNLRAICNFLNVSAADLDERFTTCDLITSKEQIPPPVPDTIQNTPELRECIKDAMMRTGVMSAEDLNRLIGYDCANTLERLLAGKLNWFPDVLSSVLDYLKISHDDVPVSPAERMLLMPEGIYRQGAELIRPIPVVDWANAAEYVGSLVTGNSAIMQKWNPETTEVIPAPVGVRRGAVSFRVHGQSMEPKIFDGDKLICEQVERLEDVPSNRVVVVHFTDDYKDCPGCMVCKRLRRIAGTICLTSDNNESGRIFEGIAPGTIDWAGVVVAKYTDNL